MKDSLDLYKGEVNRQLYLKFYLNAADVLSNALHLTCRLSRELSQSVVSISLRLAPERSISA